MITIFTFDKSNVFFSVSDILFPPWFEVSEWRLLAKRCFCALLMPADLKMHRLRASSGHFAFVLRKVSGVEMEAERLLTLMTSRFF